MNRVAIVFVAELDRVEGAERGEDREELHERVLFRVSRRLNEGIG